MKNNYPLINCICFLLLSFLLNQIALFGQPLGLDASLGMGISTAQLGQIQAIAQAKNVHDQIESTQSKIKQLQSDFEKAKEPADQERIAKEIAKERKKLNGDEKSDDAKEKEGLFKQLEKQIDQGKKAGAAMDKMEEGLNKLKAGDKNRESQLSELKARGEVGGDRTAAEASQAVKKAEDLRAAADKLDGSNDKLAGEMRAEAERIDGATKKLVEAGDEIAQIDKVYDKNDIDTPMMKEQPNKNFESAKQELADLNKPFDPASKSGNSTDGGGNQSAPADSSQSQSKASTASNPNSDAPLSPQDRAKQLSENIDTLNKQIAEAKRPWENNGLEPPRDGDHGYGTFEDQKNKLLGMRDKSDAGSIQDKMAKADWKEPNELLRNETIAETAAKQAANPKEFRHEGYRPEAQRLTGLEDPMNGKALARWEDATNGSPTKGQEIFATKDYLDSVKANKLDPKNPIKWDQVYQMKDGQLVPYKQAVANSSTPTNQISKPVTSSPTNQIVNTARTNQTQTPSKTPDSPITPYGALKGTSKFSSSPVCSSGTCGPSGIKVGSPGMQKFFGTKTMADGTVVKVGPFTPPNLRDLLP